MTLRTIGIYYLIYRCLDLIILKYTVLQCHVAKILHFNMICMINDIWYMVYDSI